MSMMFVLKHYLIGSRSENVGGKQHPCLHSPPLLHPLVAPRFSGSMSLSGVDSFRATRFVRSCYACDDSWLSPSMYYLDTMAHIPLYSRLASQCPQLYIFVLVNASAPLYSRAQISEIT